MREVSRVAASQAGLRTSTRNMRQFCSCGRIIRRIPQTAEPFVALSRKDVHSEPQDFAKDRRIKRPKDVDIPLANWMSYPNCSKNSTSRVHCCSKRSHSRRLRPHALSLVGERQIAVLRDHLL